MPLYEYEHLLGWASVERHVASEITLLCDQHHREKTSGLLPMESVLAANANPLNLRAGVSKPYDLHYSGDQCEAVIGGNRFTTRDQGYGTLCVPLYVDGTPLLGFVLTDGHLLLNLNLFDESNNLVLQIRNNQLVQSVEPWDIQFVGRNLVVRLASRQILVDLSFEVPNRVVVQRGRFLLNGVEVLVRPDYLLVSNNRIVYSDNSATNVPFGLVIGPHDPGGSAVIRLTSIGRYLGDREAARRWAEEVLDSGPQRVSRGP